MVEYYQKVTPNEPLTRLRSARSEHVWVHSNGVQDLLELVDRYDLNRNITLDVRDEREMARVEANGDSVYVFFRKLTKERDGHASSGPVLAVLHPDVFLTLSPHTNFSPQHLDGALLPSTDNQGALLLALLLHTVTEYEHRVHDAAGKIEHIRNRLRTHEVSDEDFVLFVAIDDNLNHYHQNLEGFLSVLRRLRESKRKLFTDTDLESLDDIILYVEQVMAAIGSYAKSVSSIQNAYSTIANNRLNHRMKALTVFTVLLTLPNVVYGMFGMNVALPFQKETWAYGGIVSGTALIIVVIYAVAKRLRLF